VLPPIGGFFMTTNPARSRCSTSRFATISAMISSAAWTRFVAVKAQRECERGGKVRRSGGTLLNAKDSPQLC
jgi:hypothetical protein